MNLASWSGVAWPAGFSGWPVNTTQKAPGLSRGMPSLALRATSTLPSNTQTASCAASVMLQKSVPRMPTVAVASPRLSSRRLPSALLA
jgi:hypothetical protein